MANIPITPGSGGASVATETVGGQNFQQVEIYGGGGASILGINPDRSINASIIGTPTVLVGGSVIAVNQSSSVVAIVTGSVAVSNFPTTQNVSGSVVAFVSGVVPVAVGGSIIAVNQSSSIIAIVTGSVVALTTGNQSVSGAVTAPPGSVMTVNQLAGSVLAVSGSFAPSGNQSVSGAVTAPPGSVMTVNQLAGSVLAVSGSFTPAANQSVSGAVTAPAGSVMTIATLAGSVLATSAVSPAGSITSITIPAGSITAVSAVQPAGSLLTVIQLAGSILATSATVLPGSVSGAITAPPGSVMAVRTDLASVITVQKAGSVISVAGATTTTAGSIISATFPAGSITAVSGATTTTAGSVISSAFPAGSVAAVRTDNASVITVGTNVGSVIAIIQAQSIVGTYSEDVTHATGDKGIFMLHVRNDTLASVTSADLEYSTNAVGPAGETVVANAPFTKWVSGTASMLGGVPMTCSVTVIAAQGASIFTYITGVQVANLGSASVLVSFGGATSSIRGYTIAPAGGGSNIVFPNALKTNENAAFSASISGTASIYIAAQGFISKT